MQKAGFLKDTMTMSGRCLLLSKRNPDIILTSLVAPILMMILFAYVLGGAMNVGNRPMLTILYLGLFYRVSGNVLQRLR